MVSGAGGDGRLGVASRDVRMDTRAVKHGIIVTVRGWCQAEPGNGWCKACKFSCSPARIKSLDDAKGICTFVGNLVRM